MISITCPLLETARANPSAYGQMLAVAGGKIGGGGRAMISCVQEVARLVHLNELSVSQAIKELHNKFIHFKDTQQNKKRQEQLTEQFVRYCKQFDKLALNFLDGYHLMKWNFSPNTRISGRTPWVMANDIGYFSYLLSEKNFDWQSQLRFPLFQYYLANHTIDCTISEMNVGIYSLDEGDFQFKSFSKKEISSVISETNLILNTVFTEYNKRKKSNP